MKVKFRTVGSIKIGIYETGGLSHSGKSKAAECSIYEGTKSTAVGIPYSGIL